MKACLKIKQVFRSISPLFGILGIAVFSCSKENPPTNKNYFGVPFSLKINESTLITTVLSENNIPDSTLSIKFIKVISDTRSPKASCYLCYGSSASIQVFLANKNYAATIPLTILGCRDEYSCDDQLYYRKDTLGYRICLLRLDPYPDSDPPVNQMNYTAKLSISKL
jgi:hypothetical protein